MKLSTSIILAALLLAQQLARAQDSQEKAQTKPKANAAKKTAKQPEIAPPTMADVVSVEYRFIQEYSPHSLVTADDPPIYLFYNAPPALGQDQNDPTHTSNFGVKLQEKLHSVGVPCELVYPGAPDVKHPRVQDYLIEKLKAPAAK